MPRTPTRTVIAVQLFALGAAGVVAAWRAPNAEWDAALFAILLVLAIASDLLRIEVRAHRVYVSASFLAIVTAAVFTPQPPVLFYGGYSGQHHPQVLKRHTYVAHLLPRVQHVGELPHAL